MEENDKRNFKTTMESLNEMQRQSVSSDAKYLQILAGPGSGKTRVLTCRVAYLVLEKNILPGDIIVVTFTNKAANEMKERLRVLIGAKNTKALVIGTFHSICSRMLRYNAKAVGIRHNFTVADNADSKSIIAEIVQDKALKLSEYSRKEKPASIYSKISKAKSEGYTAESYADGKGERTPDLTKIFLTYQEKLTELNMMDFDDLLLKARELFHKKKTLLSHVKAILVDEYQDTNIVQYDLVKLATNQMEDKSVTIVGDPDQSIFSFRSAEPENFSKMKKEFKGTQTINMEQNYRSSSQVLKAAFHVVSQDTQRIDKALYTNNPEGIPISLIDVKDETEQARFIAREIKSVIKYSKGLVNYKDIAILLRFNYLSRNIETALRASKIPFTMVGGERFFDRMEIKDITSYLRFAYNPQERTSFMRIINVPKRGIGKVSLQKIIDIHQKEGKGDDMLETLKKIERGKGDFASTMRTKIRNLVVICEEVQQMIQANVGVNEVLKFIIEATEYKKYLEESYPTEKDSRWGNVSELVNLAVAFMKNELIDEDDFFSQGNSQRATQDPAQSSDDILFNDTTTVDEVDVVEEDDAEVDEKNESKNGEDDSEDEEVIDLTVLAPEDINDSEGDEEPAEATNSSATVTGSAFSDDPFASFRDSEDEEGNSGDAVMKFLEYCSLCSNQKEFDDAKDNRVTVATMHASKGLEWPCVFVMSCVEAVIPAMRAENINEEARLLYVAMTRSQFLLYCTSHKYRNIFGNTDKTSRSRFLARMPKNLYTTESPGWDNEIRGMLATILNQPHPENDDTLVTTKKDKSTGYRVSSSSNKKYAGFTSARNVAEEMPTKRKSKTSKPATKRTKK